MGYQERIFDEVSGGPAFFARALQQLGQGNVGVAKAELESMLPHLDKLDEEWVGPTYCCYAFCLKEMKDYYNAIKYARLAKKHKLNFIGSELFYQSLIPSLNETNNLSEALKFARDGADFFLKQDSAENFCSCLEIKSNILKQIAGPLSRDIAKISEAKEYAIEAIHAICTSTSMFGVDSKNVEDELSALSRIAGRAGVQRKDLPFLDEMTAIKEIAEHYFDELALARMAVSQRCNVASEAIQQGNRSLGKQWYEKALEIASEAEPHDRAFKAIVAYQYGVCLLKMYDLEGKKPPAEPDSGTVEAVNLIRQAWDMTLQLASTLTKDEVADFDKNLPPGLTSAVRNIVTEPLMSDWLRERTSDQPKGKGPNEINQKNFAEAIRLIESGNYEENN